MIFMASKGLTVSFAAAAVMVCSFHADAQVPVAAATEKAIIGTPSDVFEPLNRAIFGFNTAVVDWFVDPLADLLDKASPSYVRRIGTNVYENLSEPEFIFTNLMAGYYEDAVVSVRRFAINSTVGIGGIFDVATPIGLERRSTEVSEAMCKAGIPPGPYLVLPLIGATNLFSGGLLGAALLAEWYALGLVSTTLATAEVIFDITVAVASLRHIRDIPRDHDTDVYAVQQKEFWDYVNAGCAPASETRPVASAPDKTTHLSVP
jgi:phospholipid-binding lipoprotein MlaA